MISPPATRRRADIPATPGDPEPRSAPGAAVTGFGVGWRPEIAGMLAARADLGFVEVIVENMPGRGPLPPALLGLGVPVVPHGIGLSLGGAEPPEAARLRRIATLAQALDAPLVSEHAAFVRTGGHEAGHLLPVPHTRDALAVLTANVRIARAELPVPLALENPASLLRWPDNELTLADFLTELAERTDAPLLLDISNLYGDTVNHGLDPATTFDRLPWERVAYLHVAGGVMLGEHYHDTHLHRVGPGPLELLAEAVRRLRAHGRSGPGQAAYLLERDGHYPPPSRLHDELDEVVTAAGDRPARRPLAPPPPGALW
ncbi:DUF692 domain-containing protein [Frankia sp. CNm7]|uniref:DUF692 domain-containing protein n=1 Tax=Frankia nepalensis TaxID=1836974 RepID=A0A937R9V3_9ACTN|nr:DUF692 domain-containing protein [Frankia nepalensis]MBL7501458.1 DUF692 domain-containing protein [Frankia nepalensis]MBL7513306.1 DUF692 domain-containing protein [Frankia nepalensis]MBL7522953.1 DUF692 domain-containing protein [Frankia nepalensis]MBL7626392.1 DUF692 domain-containing protein [Frankia nepalensis]